MGGGLAAELLLGTAIMSEVSCSNGCGFRRCRGQRSIGPGRQPRGAVALCTTILSRCRISTASFYSLKEILRNGRSTLVSNDYRLITAISLSQVKICESPAKLM